MGVTCLCGKQYVGAVYTLNIDLDPPGLEVCTFSLGSESPEERHNRESISPVKYLHIRYLNFNESLLAYASLMG